MTYVNWMFLLLIMCLTGCQTADSNPEEKTSAERPNIVLILADDMGFSDLGSYGSEIATPNLDSLAFNGLRMTQFYNASRCCPTRASLLTGVYPHQANMGFMQEDCNLPGYGGYIPDHVVTIAQALEQGGYTTAMSGKWHVGNDSLYWPTKKGFQKFYGFPHHGGAYFYPFPGDQVLYEGETQITPDSDFYSTEAINANAVRFVNESLSSEDNTPFFLYLAHVAPHFPLQAKTEDIAKYRGTYLAGFDSIRQQRFKSQKKLGILPENYPISKADTKVPDWKALSADEKDDYDLRMSVYAAQIEAMDRGIGDLIQLLKEKDQLDNTVILFLSDNGGTREDYSNSDMTGVIGGADSFACYTLPWANVSNTPFRRFKHWGHEGGIRTPLIVHYPDLVQKGSLDDQPGHIIDVMPTLLELAGVEYPDVNRDSTAPGLEGRSLLPVFRGEQRQAHEGLFWEHEGNKAARVGDWKWVSIYPEYREELYNLANDPVEEQNLAERFPQKLDSLKTLWQSWADRVGVQPWDKVLQAQPDQARLQIYY